MDISADFVKCVVGRNDLIAEKKISKSIANWLRSLDKDFNPYHVVSLPTPSEINKWR